MSTPIPPPVNANQFSTIIFWTGIIIGILILLIKWIQYKIDLFHTNREGYHYTKGMLKAYNKYGRF